MFDSYIVYMNSRYFTFKNKNREESYLKIKETSNIQYHFFKLSNRFLFVIRNKTESFFLSLFENKLDLLHVLLKK